MSESQLGVWLKGQYGPGMRYKSARQLSLAISDGDNPGLVFDIENRGSARVETMRKLANALDRSFVEVLLLAGWLSEDEVSEGGVTPAERTHLEKWRQLPDADRAMLEEISERLLGTGTALSGLRRVAENQGTDQAGPELQ